MKTKIIFTFAATLMSFAAFGQSKADVSAMLDKMVASGQMSEAQIQQARQELKSMSNKDFQKLIQAGKQMQNDPKIRKKIEEMGLSK